MNTKTKTIFTILISFAFQALLAGTLNAQKDDLAPEHAKKMAAGLKLFKSEVKQVLVGRCLKCHGGEEIEGEFDLSSRKTLLAGGSQGPAVLIGKSKSSLLYQLITHGSKPTMPEDGAKLEQRNIDAIASWIDLGAPYDKPLGGTPTDPLAWTRKKIDPEAKTFWTYQPLKKVNVPDFDQDDWSTNEIDKFILARLHEKKLKPNQPIEKAKLARRLYLGIIGLPPTPQELDKFVNDQSEQAVDDLVKGLLQNKHYGEKWARHWLDVARFGESHGFEQDYDRPHAYHYRDFVIKAFNSDMPFTQFVRWQIAGDELKPQEPLAMMATGFLGAGVFPTQLTEKEFEPARYDELDDMASTLGTAMLGITIGCARCHDHKFDPIPQRDYYQFISTFSTTIRSEIELELNPGEIKKELSRWQQEKSRLEGQLKNYEAETLASKFDAWLKTGPETKPLQPTWVILDFSLAKSVGGATFKRLPDGSLLATGKNPDFDQYEFVAKTNLKGITAIRIEALAHDSLVRKGPGRASNGNFALGTLTVTATPVARSGEKKIEKKIEKKPVGLTRPRATFQQNQGNLSVASSLDSNPKTGWAVDPQFGKDHAAIFELETPTAFDGETELSFNMRFDVNNKHSIGRPRISVTTAKKPVGFSEDSQQQKIIEILETLKQTKGQPNQQQRDSLFHWYRTSDAGWQEINKQIQSHLAKQPQPKKTRVMVSSEGLKPLKHHADGRKFPHFYPQTHFLKRGDTAQKQGVAGQSFLQVFSKKPDLALWKVTPANPTRLSYRRTALANWITDTQHGPGSQLARVIVNRLWQQHFGRGIVSTTNDFGFQGARPTHPELLDWLAQKLIDEKWSLKAIHRLILTSATYQQSSHFDSSKSKQDPTNQFLWRYAPRRLDAEIIRDSMLAVSDTLDRKMFGPGTLDEKMKRRSIYFMIKRSRLIPMMQIFDSPEPLVSVGSRPSTTIAPQALLFMNNPNVRQYAANFANKIIRLIDQQPNPPQLEQVIKTGFSLAIGREPTVFELNRNQRFLMQQLESYEKEKKKNTMKMAVTDFCQILFCLNEFIYVD